MKCAKSLVKTRKEKEYETFFVVFFALILSTFFTSETVLAGGAGGYKGEPCEFKDSSGKIMCGAYEAGWCSVGCIQGKTTGGKNYCAQPECECSTSGTDGFGHSFKSLKITTTEWLKPDSHDYVPYPSPEIDKKAKELVKRTAKHMCDNNCCNN